MSATKDSGWSFKEGKWVKCCTENLETVSVHKNTKKKGCRKPPAMYRTGIGNNEQWYMSANDLHQQHDRLISRFLSMVDESVEDILRSWDHPYSSRVSREHHRIRLPFRIDSHRGMDGGGLTAEFLPMVLHEVIGFENNYNNDQFNDNDICTEIYCTSSNRARVLIPSILSLSTAKDENRMHVLKKTLRRVGALIGVVCNTSGCSRSLTLGLPLDFLCLKRLFNPTAEITKEEVFQSVIGDRLSSLKNISISEARQYAEENQIEQLFPVLPFETEHPSEITWPVYIEQLTLALLDDNGPFCWIREGFDATRPFNDYRFMSFSPALVREENIDWLYRFLIGDCVDVNLLIGKLKFFNGSQELCQGLIDVLKSFSDKQREHFVKFCTGSNRLRGNDDHIEIWWTDSSEGILSHTCGMLVEMPANFGSVKNLQNIILAVITPSNNDVSFNVR